MFKRLVAFAFVVVFVVAFGTTAAFAFSPAEFQKTIEMTVTFNYDSEESVTMSPRASSKWMELNEMSPVSYIPSSLSVTIEDVQGTWRGTLNRTQIAGLRNDYCRAYFSGYLVMR